MERNDRDSKKNLKKKKQDDEQKKEKTKKKGKCKFAKKSNEKGEKKHTDK